jgi:hypothetical protein
MIWDADFMLGPPGSDGTDSYVLGEINVSSVFPIPDEASAEIARRVADRLRSKPWMVRQDISDGEPSRVEIFPRIGR